MRFYVFSYLEQPAKKHFSFVCVLYLDSPWHVWATAEIWSVASELCYNFMSVFMFCLDKVWERFGAHLETSWLEKRSCRMADTQDIPEKLKAINTFVMSVYPVIVIKK